MLSKSKFLLLILVTLISGRAAAGKDDIWVEVNAPNFRVISNAGEKRAQQVATQFETIRAVFRKALESAGDYPTPSVTVLAVKDEQTLSELLPEYWAVKGRAHPAGVFFNGLNKAYVAVRLDGGDNAFETIYHEYYHSMTVPYFPGLPLWVVEGTAEFFGHTEIAGKNARLGKPDPNLLAFLQHERMPVSSLIQVDQSSPYYNEQNKTSIFYAESWALVHYLMLGDNLAHRKQFGDFLLRIGNGEPQQRAALETFGDLNELQNQLNSYIERSTYSMLTMDTPSIDAKGFQSRPLSEAEIDAIQGDAFVRRGRFAEAEPLLKKSLVLEPKSPSARESLGSLEYLRGNRQEAERWMKEAIDLNSTDYLTYYYHAMLSAQNHVRDEAAVVLAESELRRSIALNPNFGLSHSALALSETRARDQWPDALQLARKAVQLEPGNIALRLNLGQVLLRMNRPVDALKIAETTRFLARSAQERRDTDAFIAATQEYLSSVNSANSAMQSASWQADRAKQSSPEMESKGPNPFAGTSNPKSSSVQLAEGDITDESCSLFRLNLLLSGPGAPLKLRASNYSAVEFWTNGWKVPDKFNPCVDLKGIHVRILFTPVADNSADGEIQKIEIQQQTHTP